MRCAIATLGVAALLSLSACSTPPSGQGTVATGRSRVVALLNDTLDSLPSDVHATGAASTGTATCRKKFLGYAIGSTGKHHVEGPLIVPLPGGTDPRPLLGKIEARWQNEGFTIDRSGLSNQRYPKVRATTPDGYTVVTTAITDQPPRLDLYATSPCLAG
jgi:hypothetical protein